MAATDKRIESESNRTLIIIIAVGAAVLIAGFFYLLMRSSSGSSGGGEPVLQGAIRTGSREWDQFKQRIVLDDPEADEAKRALGDTVMSLHTVVRNFTGKTLNGLEVKAAVVDHQGKSVKERTVVVIPAKFSELGPNKTIPVQVMLEGFKDTDDRANIKMELTGFKFKD